MTRKRFIKLLMSKGYDRNGANNIVAIARDKNINYAAAYKAVICGKELTDAMIPAIVQTCEKVITAIGCICKAVAAGVAAFSKAYTEAMKHTETHEKPPHG